jgi:hypothetical protein
MKTTLDTSSGILYIRRKTGKWPTSFALILMVFFTILSSQQSFSQGVGISEVSITPDASSILELQSTARGFLAPRMTTLQRNAILPPATGLLIYNTDTNAFNYFNGTIWIALLNSGTGVGAVNGTLNRISVAGTLTVPVIDIDANYVGQASITTLGTIGTGTWNAGAITSTGAVTGNSIVKSGGLATQFLKADGSVDASTYLTGNQSINFTPGAGDVTGSATGTTSLTPTLSITNKAVTLAKMADMATGSLIYRKTAGLGVPEIQTLATLKTDLLLTGTNSGDISIAGQNYLSLAGQTLTANAVDLSGTNVTGTLASGRFPALTGDVTTAAGSLATSIGAGKVTNAMLAGNIDLTSKVTGTLPVSNGGTGLSTTTINQLLYSSAANTISGLATNSNSILVTNGSGVPSIGNTVGAALTMPSISLSATSNQLVLQSAGQTGTLTWTPTVARTITFPDATGTVALTSDITAAQGNVVLRNGTQGLTADWNAGAHNITATTFIGALTGNVTGNVTGALTGNASTATSATTAGNVTGIVAVANGGTGSSSQNFVDLTTAQASIGGAKTWTGLGTFNAGITVTGATVSLNNDAASNTTNIGTGAAAKTVSLGSCNTTSTTTINSGTGGLNFNTGAATNAITTLGTTGSQVFASSTANADRIAIQPQSTVTGATFTGTITSSDLTAARTYTFPDASGTIALANVGADWFVGGNATAGTAVLGTTDNSGINIQSGTGTINLGADAFAKTINIGNTTGATALNLNTGTGNFTLNTNQLFLNKTSGYIGVGTVVPASPLQMVFDNNGNQNLTIDTYAGAGANSTLIGRKARGTAASPSAVQSDEVLMTFGASGYGTTQFSTATAAAVKFYAAENWTDAAQGTYFGFLTTPNGSPASSKVERLRIDNDGSVGIGTSTPTAVLHLKAGTLTANTAPLKFTSGTSLSTPEAGAVEYDGTNYFVTEGTGTRYTLAKTLTATAVLNFPSTNAQKSSDLNITVTGAALGDAIILGIPSTSNDANSNYSAWVSAANTVTVRFNNFSSLAIDPASGTYRVSVLKY